VVVLAGGGPVAFMEIAEAKRRGWPVFAIAGTGGLADSIAGSTDVHTVSDLPEFTRLLSWELHDEPLIKESVRRSSSSLGSGRRTNSVSGLMASFVWHDFVP